MRAWVRAGVRVCGRACACVRVRVWCACVVCVCGCGEAGGQGFAVRCVWCGGGIRRPPMPADYVALLALAQACDNPEQILKNEFKPISEPIKDLAWSSDNQRSVRTLPFILYRG